MIEALGLIAGFLTTFSFVPQAIKVYRTKKTQDLSLGMYSVNVAGLLCWLIYGIFIKSFPLVASNSVTLALSSYILLMKIKYK